MEEFIKKFTYYKLVNKKPTPCNLLEILLDDVKADWTVKKSKITNEIMVSTVFLGGIQNIFGDKPLFFETMVFGGEFNHYQKRYSTWEEAEKGHIEVCSEIVDNL